MFTRSKNDNRNEKAEAIKKGNEVFQAVLKKYFTDPETRKKLIQTVKEEYKYDSDKAAEKKLEELRNSFNFQATLFKTFQKTVIEIAKSTEEEKASAGKTSIASNKVL